MFFRINLAGKDAFHGNVTLTGCHTVTGIHLHLTCTTKHFEAVRVKELPESKSRRLDSSELSVELKKKLSD